MQIVINIPKEFENHFNTDRFEDSMQRIKQDIKDMICYGDVCMSGNYEVETLDMLIKSFKECTPLPKGHGNLKDLDKIEQILDLETPDNIIAKALKNLLESVPTIIEASVDKESEI